MDWRGWASTVELMVRDFDDSLRYTAPEAVGAMVFADSHRNGSPKQRRRNRVIAWIVLLGFAFAFGSMIYGTFWG